MEVRFFQGAVYLYKKFPGIRITGYPDIRNIRFSF